VAPTRGFDLGSGADRPPGTCTSRPEPVGSTILISRPTSQAIPFDPATFGQVKDGLHGLGLERITRPMLAPSDRHNRRSAHRVGRAAIPKQVRFRCATPRGWAGLTARQGQSAPERPAAHRQSKPASVSHPPRLLVSMGIGSI
jgi:hypothetical protein